MQIRLDNGLIQPFQTTVGVFQGCNLSPILFNLYTSGLPDIFDEMCAPVYVNDVPVHVLAWADDTAVFREGLPDQILPKCRHCLNGGGSDPCLDFCEGFVHMH